MAGMLSFSILILFERKTMISPVIFSHPVWLVELNDVFRQQMVSLVFVMVFAVLQSSV